ncbi:DUF4179 domain-containing protein [Geosporobacter ferrireducens]|uniref:DUF4179 domain-containing protein n=1 Tax=Geosporobacter ferrireducens TaxID=1424294 RepID=UPI00139BCD9C|nr:DUF4179 domain-containing protein [Geosporobacter ferrireducens]MTI54902.1 DUF4179 domain-containing protein [Geosporobacter ferrireducens]
MRDLEELLRQRQKDLENLEAPPILEERLRGALSAKKRKNNRGLVAVLLICLFLVSYNFDTLAFYGKRILGFEELMWGTLKDLNELGEGQPVNESYTFGNGVTITLDGIMVDDNQLLAFYTIKDPSGKVDQVRSYTVEYRGIFGKYTMRSGQGILNEDNTEFKNIDSFEPPKAFEKTLKFYFPLKYGDTYEEGMIEIKLDRRKAMGFMIKDKIRQTITVDGTHIHFDTITATPTQTVITGSVGSRFDLVKEAISGERTRVQVLTELYADGKKIEQTGSGMSTTLERITFDVIFDALPKGVKKLEIKLAELTKTKDIHTVVVLKDGMETEKLEIEGQEVLVKEVRTEGSSTYVTIDTREDIIFRKIYLEADGKEIPLEKMMEEKLEKLVTGEIRRERVLHFKGNGENMKLLFKRICYTQAYNKRIEISVQ